MTGVAHLAADDLRTPFAAVTQFDADQSFALNVSMDCAQLRSHIDGLLPTLDEAYAVKVSGLFDSLQVRAPHRASPPYPTLIDALADQVVFDSEDAEGVMVGFRLPEYLDGVNVAGYHFHYVSDDRAHGGHVLDCRSGSVMVEIDAIDRFVLEGIAQEEVLVVVGVYSSSIQEAWEGVIPAELLDVVASR
ncbi:MAG: acetolactate decarboxylase [Caldilineaceae bacterium]|nr:acetolactate decarboxylase [Caldilineaceae bacterium]